MFFIIDNLSRFVDAKGVLPNIEVFPVKREDAYRFQSKEHALNCLIALKEMVDFKGRVISEQDANEMGDDE